MTAADLLHDLKAQGFELRTDGLVLWVTPRQRLTEEQAAMVAALKSDLIALVIDDPEVIRRRLVETLRQVDRLAAEAGAWVERFERLGDRLTAETEARWRAETRAADAEISTWHRPEGIPPDILRSLIGLAHPDRHGNSETANRVTAWLLQQRGRLDS
jgi:hypothetical protein